MADENKDGKKCCEATTIEVGDSKAEGTGSVCITQPHIVNYPKPPPRDDGLMWAIGSIVGTMLGKYANKKIIKEAHKEEQALKDLNKKIEDAGLSDFDKAKELENKAFQLQDNVLARADQITQKGDMEYDYGQTLMPDIDKLNSEIRESMRCLYTPDYKNALSIIKADTEKAIAIEKEKICRNKDRYNIGFDCDSNIKLSMASANNILANANIAYAQEYDKKLNALKAKTEYVAKLENTRLARNQSGVDLLSRGVSLVEKSRDITIDYSYKTKLIALDLITASAKNHLWVAQSLRETAKNTLDDFSKSIPFIVNTIFGFYSKIMDKKKEC